MRRALFVSLVLLGGACPGPAQIDPSPDVDDAGPPPIFDGGERQEGDAGDVEVEPTDAGVVIEEPPFPAARTNLPAGALCEETEDPVHPSCAVEVDNDIAAPVRASSDLRVVAWNVRFGQDSEAVLEALLHNPALDADVLLLAEVARHDSRSNPVGINQARELALALGMNYAFAVTWDHRHVEGYADPKGEHGVAVLARFPIGELTPIRHTPAHDFWNDERRLGGRITLGVTLLVGEERVRVYSTHLCTRPTPLPDDRPRAVQGSEIRADADREERPLIQIVGGDFNTWTCNPVQGDCAQAPQSEQVIEDLKASGWLDGTEGFTGYTHLGVGFFPQRLDWLFYRGTVATPGGRVNENGSDHLPITTLLHLP
jgi:endonuclease/exonuclease/phosphatase family metal-dependent hydrolase